MQVGMADWAFHWNRCFFLLQILQWLLCTFSWSAVDV